MYSIKRYRLIAVQILFAFVVLSIIHVSFRSSASDSWRQLKPYTMVPWTDGDSHENIHENVNVTWPYEPQLDNITAPYVKSIMNYNNATLPRLQCPTLTGSRYDYLRAATEKNGSQDVRYFFALNLKQSEHLMAGLLGSVVETARFLGVSSCALSIVEGNSEDATRNILTALQPELQRIGLRYFLNLTDINPKVGERIDKLAQLRNLALDPLTSSAVAADADTTIVFLNDVSPCPEDLLELVHQRRLQSADMTCAMDWTYVGKDPTFYDVWVARTLRGDSFFQIPPDGSWNQAWDIFAGDPDTQRRYIDKNPFQVFACWNGATAFTAGPILGLPADPGRGPAGEAHGGQVVFRFNRKDECYAGEPTLFCKDLWWAGYGRIAVIPSVNIEYSDEASTKIKELKGFTSKWTAQEDLPAAKILWEAEPPEKWKCMHGWENQVWVPWNQTLS
ncbi:Alpha-1-3-mannosyltransferase CMT1 [Apiospora arundinis]